MRSLRVANLKDTEQVIANLASRLVLANISYLKRGKTDVGVLVVVYYGYYLFGINRWPSIRIDIGKKHDASHHHMTRYNEANLAF